MKRLNRFSLLQAIGCCLAVVAMAQPNWRFEGNSGGTGGSPFKDDNIPPSADLVELRVWSGEWINAIQAVYRTRDGRMIETPVHGRDGKKDGNLDGDGGHLDVLTLRPDEWITNIEGTYGKFVNRITVTLNNRRTATFGKGGEHPFQYTARPDEAIVGFDGRCSKYLDAIGVAHRNRRF